MNGQPYILVVDDDPDIREALMAVLESQPYRVAAARDGEECLKVVKREIPDLLILDLLMPRVDGFAVIRELRADPKYAELSILALTAVLEDASRRRYKLETGLELDIQDYIQKPVSPDELLRRVSALLEQPYILVVDDDPDILDGIIMVLETQACRLATARDGVECMELIKKRLPSLIILDLLMPRMDGFAVIRELRRNPQYAKIPIIVLTTVVEDASRRRYELETGLSMDVQAYLQKPVPPAELLNQVSKVLG